MPHRIGASLWREVQLFPFVFDRMVALVKSRNLLSQIEAAADVEVVSGLERETSGNRQLDMASLLSPEMAGAALPSPDQLLEAFTAKGAGESVDLERLEFLGDTFLKFA